MIESLIDPDDSIERQNEKLKRIVEALMRRVEQDTDRSGAAFGLFERAALLEDQVRERTCDLERTLDLLNDANGRLEAANRQIEMARADLASAIEAIEEGFALFGADDALVMCNSRFGVHTPDIRPQLTPGLTFAAYVSAVGRSAHLAPPAGVTAEDWAAQRMERHRDSHVLFNVPLVEDRWLQVSEHRTPNGGTVILQTDVTDLMRAERAERGRIVGDQARMMRATLDHIRQGVCIFDQQARIVGWNRRMTELFFLGQDRIAARAGFDAVLAMLRPYIGFPSEIDEAALIAWARQARVRPPLSFEISVGAAQTLDVFAQETPDRGFLISFTDVTAERSAARALADANASLERRVLERTLELQDAVEAAERANASKTRFVAAASHDLLQPLSAAKLYVAAIGDAVRDQPAGRIATKAQDALDSVEGIIGALLEISKLDAGGDAGVTQCWTPLSDLFDGLRNEFAPIAAQKGLDFQIVQSRAQVRSDPALLRRVLQNLISNAIRYTPHGRVLVGARRAGSSLRLEVRDTGIGIAADDQDVIFEEFRRLGARASASEGLGLGLAIVDRACARLGHPLSLQSELGRGAAFFVTVKRGDFEWRRGPKTTKGAPRTPDRAAASGRVVLLVDNDADMRSALAHLIEGWGGSVIEAHGPADIEAESTDAAFSPDAILIDYQLDDGVDGLALLCALRRRFVGVPARLISAERSPELRRRCAEAAVELLNKPIDTAKLQAFLSSSA